VIAGGSETGIAHSGRDLRPMTNLVKEDMEYELAGEAHVSNIAFIRAATGEKSWIGGRRVRLCEKSRGYPANGAVSPRYNGGKDDPH
jgi:hypothetical protein